MSAWLVIVIAVSVVVVALVLWGGTHGRERRPESRPVETGGHREKLARDAGIASFGLNLPWRRTRRDPRA